MPLHREEGIRTKPSPRVHHAAVQTVMRMSLNSLPPQKWEQVKRGLRWKGPCLPATKICTSGLCPSLLLEEAHIWPASAHPGESSGEDILAF